MITKASLWGTIAAGVAAAGIVAVALAGTSTPAAVAEGGTDPAATKALSPLLASAQRSEDALPTFLTEGDQAMPGVVASSTRHLGSRDGANFWLATNQDGEACLISLMPGADRLASMNCLPAETAWKQGLALQVVTPTSSTRLYFVPDGYNAKIAGFTKVGDQLLVGDAVGEAKPVTVKSVPSAARSRSVSGATYGGATIELPAFPAPDRTELER